MSLNIPNVLFAISLMEGADKLNMCSFQSGGTTAEDLDSFHRCGNTACFVGYLAMTSLWKDFFKDIYGENIKLTYDGRVESIRKKGGETKVLSWDEESLAKFLGIEERIAEGFIYGVNGFYKPAADFADVKPEHVINKLNELLDEVGYERT